MYENFNLSSPRASRRFTVPPQLLHVTERGSNARGHALFNRPVRACVAEECSVSLPLTAGHVTLGLS